jgi:hypothetical protein
MFNAIPMRLRQPTGDGRRRLHRVDDQQTRPWKAGQPVDERFEIEWFLGSDITDARAFGIERPAANVAAYKGGKRNRRFDKVLECPKSEPEPSTT